jgi:DNA-directed RNA polymerase specialized sigma24 family protein
MDAGERGTGANWAGGAGEGVTLAPGSGRRRPFGSERVGQILGEWQGRELRVARGFVECRGLSKEQLEDIYQETTLALYSRPYDSEEHLRNALRDGIKKRALRLHRDEHRHGQIRARSAPGLRLMAETREEQTAPEPAVLAKEDRLIALEFKTELDEDEQRVFAWLVEGLQYRAVASVLNIPVNEARNTARSCERKRERFQLLYDTGRLCGYRAQTILALQNGEVTSEVLAERAFAHLESCAHSGWSTGRTPSGCGAASATRRRLCSRRCSSVISDGWRDSTCERGSCCTASGSTQRRSVRVACANGRSLCSRVAASARRSPSGSSPLACSPVEQSPRTSSSRAPHRSATTSRGAQQPRPAQPRPPGGF